MGFVPFWRMSAHDLTKRPWRNGHMRFLLFGTLEMAAKSAEMGSRARRNQARWHQN
jgi:hypothetical protein